MRELLFEAAGRPRSRAVRATLLVAACFACAAVLYQEVLHDARATGYGDYQYFHHIWEAAWISVVRYHEWPLWNPFHCGGITQWGDPQTQVFHPLFLLSFLTGTTVALKIFLLTHAAAGLLGAYLLARREEQLSSWSSALVAVAWAGSGYFAFHCGTGHANFIAFYLTPWLVYGWRRSVAGDVRWGAGVAAVMALTLLAGGVYAFPFFVIVLAYETVCSLIGGRPLARVASTGLIAVLLTVLLGGIRLLPILAELESNPRLEQSPDSIPLALFVRALTWQDHTWPLHPLEGLHWYWVEYSAYVGWPVFLLGIAGAVVAVRRLDRRQRSLYGSVLFGLLTLGAFAPWAPWVVLHRVPIFDQLHVPSRFSVIFLLYFTPLAGHALDAASGAMRRRWPARRVMSIALAVGVALIGIVDVASEHVAVLDAKWRHPVVRAGVPLPYFVAMGPRPDQGLGEDIDPPPASLPRANVGTAYCYSGMHYHGAVGLWRGWREQARVVPAGTLLSEASTTNTVSAVVSLPRAARVVFNRTWAPNWTTSVGTLVRDRERIAVDAPPGVHTITLRYEPPTVPWALGSTAFGLLLLLLLLRRRRRWLGSWGGAVVLGAASAGAIFCTLAVVRDTTASEPPAPRPFLPHASASIESEVSSTYQPWNAMDGRISTEWILPDGQPGWLELRAEAPQPVTWLRLVNVRNEPYRDRASDRVRVEAWLGDELAASDEGRLPTRWDGAETYWDVYVHAPRIDRIRVEILTWHGSSGGLAEVRVIGIPTDFDPVVGVGASSQAEDHPAALAHDNNEQTEWRPADSETTPWLELRFHRPSSIGGALVLPAAEGSYRLVLTRDGEPAGTFERSLPLEGAPGWLDFPLNTFADRVRVEPVTPDGPAAIREVRVY